MTKLDRLRRIERKWRMRASDARLRRIREMIADEVEIRGRPMPSYLELE